MRSPRGAISLAFLFAALATVSGGAMAGGGHGGRTLPGASLLAEQVELYRYQTSRLLGVFALAAAGLLLCYLVTKRRLPRRPGEPANLLDVPLVSRILLSRFFLPALQLPVFLVFILVVWTGLSPTRASGYPNLALVVGWSIWWPGVILATALIGRFWCAVCPFGLLNDLVQKLVTLGRGFPRPLRSLWLQLIIFQAVTAVFLYFGIQSSPFGTSLLLIGLAAGALVAGVLFERRSFCRFVCPLGAMLGPYSMVAPLELRVRSRELCSRHAGKDCIKGNRRAKACPMLEYPGVMDRNMNCNFCMECVKACPYGNLRLSFRCPGTDLWSRTSVSSVDEPSVTAALVGLTLLETAIMSTFWPDLKASLVSIFTASPPGDPSSPLSGLGFLTVYLVWTMVFPMLGALALAWLTQRLGGSNGETSGRLLSLSYVRVGHVLIPVALGIHLAHNLEHLLAQSTQVVPAFRGFAASLSRGAGSVLGLAGTPIPGGLDRAGLTSPLTSPWSLFWLQALVVGAGLALALAAAHLLFAVRQGGAIDGCTAEGRIAEGGTSGDIFRRTCGFCGGGLEAHRLEDSALRKAQEPAPAPPSLGAFSLLASSLALLAWLALDILGLPMTSLSQVRPGGAPRVSGALSAGAAPGRSETSSIAFISYRDGPGKLFTMRADGTGVRMLGRGRPGEDLEAAWSPDGRFIAYVNSRDGKQEVNLMNQDGSDPRKLSQSPADAWAPLWSPDSSRLAFVVGVGKQAEIYVVNADGSNQTRLTDDASWDYPRSWSQDGRTILFESDRDGFLEVYALDLTSLVATRLTPGPGNNGDPALSPDGKQIAFSSDRDGNREIYVVRSDGQGERRLTRNKFWDGHPYWSPGGTRILFESDRGPGGSFEIVSMFKDGSLQRRLTANTADDRHPAWSPLGDKIIFESDRDGSTDILVMDPDGSNQVNLTRNPALDIHPSW